MSPPTKAWKQTWDTFEISYLTIMCHAGGERDWDRSDVLVLFSVMVNWTFSVYYVPVMFSHLDVLRFAEDRFEVIETYKISHVASLTSKRNDPQDTV